MALNVNTNLGSLVAAQNLGKVEVLARRAIGRLSSGLRIHSSADDAAGLAISEKMRARIRSLEMAQRNANDGISFSNAADGSLREVSNMLIRMRELAIQSLNGINGVDERTALNNEFQALKTEIDRIANTTEFNGTSLLNATASVAFQVGAGTTSVNQIKVNTVDATINGLGIATNTGGMTEVNISSIGGTNSGATGAIALLDAALSSVNEFRGDFGAAINRLSATVINLGDIVQATTAAESQIRDLDVAKESAEFTRLQVLQQAGAAILSQANASSQLVLQLFR